MNWTRCKRCAQAGFVVAVACILHSGCTSSTAGVSNHPDQAWDPGIAPAPVLDTSPGEPLDGSPLPSDREMQDRAAGVGREVTSASSPGFSLDIELDNEPRFHVLSERDLGPAEAMTPPVESQGPEVVALLTPSLIYLTGQDRVPVDLQITFKPLTWDDLDAWEKTGLVVSYASSVVGAAYFLYSLFD